MKFRNPLVAPDFNMQDIRGDAFVVREPVRQILRVEGLACLVLSCVIYQALDFHWGQFALWFFLPDIGILAYVLVSERLGMFVYNLTHSSIGASMVGVVGVLLHEPLCWQIGLIWFTHIGFNRALGYGLKFPLGFRVTHLDILKGMAEKS